MQTATLSRADIEAHDPEGGRGGRWLCPMPECAEHTDPRRHRSLSLVPETGLWHCHRCHAQGQVKESWKDFKPRSKKERDADLMARRRVGLEKILAKVATPDADQKSAPAPEAHARRWSLLKDRFGSLSRLETSRPALAYLATRGLSSPDALALLTASGVRFAPDFGRREATETVKASSGTASVVFPLRDAKGKLIAAQGRFLKPWSSGQKFHTLGDKLAGVFATHGAMEIMQKGGPVAIVEAPLDAVTLALAGVPALALCGCNGLPEWLQRKACGRHWLIAFDNDENGAGDRAAEKIGEALRTLGGHVQRLKPTEAKDWNDALQIGGEVWDRTAEALRALIAREAKARPVAGEPLRQTETENQWENQDAIQGKNQSCAMAQLLPIGNNHGENQSSGISTMVEIHEKNQTLSPDLTHWQERGIFHATTQDRLASAWGAAHAFHKPLAGVVWHKDKGVKVEDIARWLQLRNELIEKIEAGQVAQWGQDAPLWTETKTGARIARELCEFARWWFHWCEELD